MTGGENEDEGNASEVNWLLVGAWTCFGVALLCAAGAAEAAWDWKGVTTETMVHVGGTLLLAPLLPFLEKSLTLRVVKENKRMVRQETAGLQQQMDSLTTRIDQLQPLLDQQDAENVQDQDGLIEALREDTSFMNVASAMTVANLVGALPDGEITIHTSSDPLIDISFSWRHHVGDARHAQLSGTALSITAHVEPDLDGTLLPIQTVWMATEKTETVIQRINDQLQQKHRWNGPGTINWEQVFRDLHRSIVLSVAYTRGDTAAPWQLHGGLYELHGEDWAITTAGIEYRQTGQVVLDEAEFPQGPRKFGWREAAARDGWPPAAPEGADPAEWQQVLERGLWHLPVRRGPVFASPGWYPRKTLPEQLTAATSTR